MKPISLLICALGGEGGGVLTQWLVEIARQAGFAAQSTSIPGVAQRTGATTYYLEVFPLAIALLQGRQPVFSLNPVPGSLDAMVSSELLETTRQIANGMSSPDRTLVITSSSRIFTTQERMQLADGRADSAELLKVVAAFSREHHVFDMAGQAQRCGTVVSAVMLGAIAGSGLFPFAREHYESVVRGGGGHRPKPACAASRGRSSSCSANPARNRCRPLPLNRAPPMGTDATGNGLPVPPSVAAGFPAPVHDMLALGHARMLEYQDRAYGQLYLQRMQSVLEAERDGRPAGAARLRHHARDGALAGAVDGVRRHRAGGRSQEPRQPLAARQGRSQGRRRRPAARLRSFQAGRSRIRGALANAPGQSRAAAGTASGCSRARRPGRCR